MLKRLPSDQLEAESERQKVLSQNNRKPSAWLDIKFGINGELKKAARENLISELSL